MILYIHGFNSSPQSTKAQQTLSFLQQNFPQTNVIIPQIPCYPQPAINLLEDIFVKNQKVIKGVIGSSLGGYLASYFVEKYSVKSVIVNPAVRPYELLGDIRGVQTNPYTKEQFELTQAHMDALKSIDTPLITLHDNYWLLQQEGDEVLDYTQAVAKYAGCKQTVEPGGDHRFVGFERFLPGIAEFFQLTQTIK
jgi:predicted esterase YcpF (UPF0227 family)